MKVSLAGRGSGWGKFGGGVETKCLVIWKFVKNGMACGC